jgi:hypothetical protein
MWRLARAVGPSSEFASPYLYMAMAARCASSCAIAVRNDHIVGLAILQPPMTKRGAARLLQLCVDRSEDELETGTALLTHLLERAPYRDAAIVELGAGCPPRLRSALGRLALMSLAKRGQCPAPRASAPLAIAER